MMKGSTGETVFVRADKNEKGEDGYSVFVYEGQDLMMKEFFYSQEYANFFASEFVTQSDVWAQASLQGHSSNMLH